MSVWLAAISLLPVYAAPSPSSAGATTLAAGQGRPNVIILLTDDQGYGDLSCHGNPVLKTPNMDRLHGEAVRFTDFHVTPKCTPTRGQLMTGWDALHNGATSVTAGRAVLRRDVPTMADIFAASGYRTGLFGKWHLGDNYPYRPMDRGFQESCYFHGWGLSESAPEFANTYSDGTFLHNGVREKFSGYCTELWFGRALAWMKERGAKGEPFLCYLPVNVAHGPMQVPEQYAKLYAKPGWPAKFFGMLANLDENIGRLETFLRETGLRENTIFIFMTDNGGTGGVKLFNAGMRGAKSSPYEGGHRVPCFVRWPAGRFGAPRDVATPASNTDILPTLIELCGLAKPAGATFDGVSLAGLLRGTGAPADRMLVVQQDENPEPFTPAAVIWNQWRLVNGTELFDIKADPGQKSDVAAQHADVVAKMRAHYEKWWARIEPGLRDYQPITIGAAQENPAELTCSDWIKVYCDNATNIRTGIGGPQGSAWVVFVEQDGDYAITLRRWPAELDLPLTAAEKGKAFPIARAKLTCAGQEAIAEAAPGAKSVTLNVKLKGGVKAQLQAWFQDAAGHDLCGAYYASVLRITK
jgi:arylsulfatase A-like enzyme